MKKNDIFEFKAPNGAVVTAVAVDTLRDDKYQKWWLCYAQNKLFYYWCHLQWDDETGELDACYSYDGVAVDYAILPDYDSLLMAKEKDYVEEDELEQLTRIASTFNIEQFKGE